MIKSKPKKVLKRRNPNFNDKLKTLLGKKVHVFSKYAVISGKLEINIDEYYYIYTSHAKMGFRSENINFIERESIYLDDIEYSKDKSIYLD